MAKKAKLTLSPTALFFYSDLSAKEKAVLDEWLSGNGEVRRLLVAGTGKAPDQAAVEEIVRERLEQIRQRQRLPFITEMPVRRRPLIWVRWAAAAIVIVLLTGRHTVDVAPGRTRAILRLGNGMEVELEHAKDGLLFRGDGPAGKKNGQLVDNGFVTGDGYYTVTTPNGGRYSLFLPDGTAVWLNAASSIRFPAVFSGDKRIVTVTGEAYFDVASLAVESGEGKMPFVAELSERKVSIEVTGTHFNVKAYPGEDTTKITLLEGEIKVTKENWSAILKPLQEIRITNTGQAKWVGEADTLTTIAWKNEVFRFENSAMETVMKEIGRWYDMEIEYEGDVPRKIFSGTIGRNNNLSQVLLVLKMNGVFCSIQGKKIVVKALKN